MKTLYIHVGVHRTATTNIQATLFKNWPRLLEKGYLYPFGVERHIGLINDLFAGRKTVAEAARMIDERIHAHPTEAKAIVLSDEDISMRRDLSLLGQFRDYFDVKIVIAMRRQDLWLESWWAQNVKGQWDKELSHISWDSFIAQRARFHWIDYARYIGHLTEVFGRGNVIPFVFEKEQMPNGPVAAFCRAIGVEDISNFQKAGGKNISLVPEMSEFVRQLPFLNAKMRYRLALIEAAETVNAKIKAEGGPTLILPHDLRLEIMDGYAEGNQRVAHDFFDRDALFLEPLPAADAPVTTPKLPDDPDVLMERLVTPFMEAVVKRFGFDA